MITVDEVKVGQLVWWRADRRFREWNCPGVITDVTEKSFSVRAFDDFAESKDLVLHDGEPHFHDPEGFKSTRHEMRLATRDEVQDYLDEVRQKLVRAHERAAREIQKHDDRVKRAFPIGAE